MDYYGYGPLFRLQRPLALCGVPGAEVGTTARVVTMLTGLPLVRLAHRVAHVLGESHGRALLTRGEAAVVAEETRQLDEALRGPAPAVIALTSHTLVDATLRRRVLDQCDVMHLRLDLPVALERIRRDAAHDPSKHLHVRGGGDADDDAVLARLRFLDRLCREAPRSLVIGTRLPLEVGRELAARLEGASAPAVAGG
jgi:shikimate kinase